MGHIARLHASDASVYVGKVTRTCCSSNCWPVLAVRDIRPPRYGIHGNAGIDAMVTSDYCKASGHASMQVLSDHARRSVRNRHSQPDSQNAHARFYFQKDLQNGKRAGSDAQCHQLQCGKVPAGDPGGLNVKGQPLAS